MIGPRGASLLPQPNALVIPPSLPVPAWYTPPPHPPPLVSQRWALFPAPSGLSPAPTTMGRFRVRRLPPSVAELVITLSNRHVKTQLWDRATHRVVVAAESVEPVRLGVGWREGAADGRGGGGGGGDERRRCTL